MEEKKKYEFRKLMATDIFTMTKIISLIGVNKFVNCFKNEEVQKLMNDLKENTDKKSTDIELLVGGGIFLEVAQVVLEGLNKCEDHVFKLLSDTSNLSLEEVKSLDGVTFFEMIIDFIKKDEFKDFIKAASKFVKKEN